MKKNLKIEIIILIVLTILNFFLIKRELNSLVYLLLFIPASIYFFPIKPIVSYKNGEKDNLIYKFISCFIISLAIILSYINFLVGHKFIFIKITYLIELILNLFFIYYFIERKNKTYLLHFLILSLNAMCYFGS